MKKTRRSGRSDEGGFALLLVFVMAAAIAITLYIEVPRIAFESQRTREQLTIDRALQYQRAIQLFYRKYQTYPQTLDDLETTRNIRFLRRRYLDPLTGKEFRLLHVGPAGQLTDSLVQPPAPLPGSSTGNGPNSAPGSPQTLGSAQTTGATPNSPQANASQPNSSQQPADPNNPNDPNAQPPDPLNMALRRPSDRIIGARGPGVDAGNGIGTPNEPIEEPLPVQEPEPAPNQPQQPVQPVQQPYPAQPVQQPGDPNEPVVPQDPTQPQTPGQPQIPGQPQLPGQPLLPGQPGATDPSQAPQTPVQFPPGVSQPSGANPGQTPTNLGQTPMPPQYPGQPITGTGRQGFGPGAPAPGAGQQSAANLIQQILTTPRQPPSSMGGFTSGNTGGIAGVASTADGKGIHVVNDHSKYKEWEFVYDVKKDKTVVGAAAVNQQQQVQQQMNQNGTSSPFGSNSSGGSNSPFGSNSPGSSPFGSSSTNSASPSAPAAPTTAPPTQ